MKTVERRIMIKVVCSASSKCSYVYLRCSVYQLLRPSLGLGFWVLRLEFSLDAKMWGWGIEVLMLAAVIFGPQYKDFSSVAYIWAHDTENQGLTTWILASGQMYGNLPLYLMEASLL